MSSQLVTTLTQYIRPTKCPETGRYSTPWPYDTNQAFRNKDKLCPCSCYKVNNKGSFETHCKTKGHKKWLENYPQLQEWYAEDSDLYKDLSSRTNRLERFDKNNKTSLKSCLEQLDDKDTQYERLQVKANDLEVKLDTVSRRERARALQNRKQLKYGEEQVRLKDEEIQRLNHENKSVRDRLSMSLRSLEAKDEKILRLKEEKADLEKRLKEEKADLEKLLKETPRETEALPFTCHRQFIATRATDDAADDAADDANTDNTNITAKMLSDE